MSGRKRMEALDEILSSERDFVGDMAKWASEFRVRVMRSPSIDFPDRQMLCERIFVNSEEVLGIHRIVLRDLEYKTRFEVREKMGLPRDEGDDRDEDYGGVRWLIENEKFEDLEYHTVFMRHADRFAAYEEYASRLSKAESTLITEVNANSGMKRLLDLFLDENDAVSLGYSHFMYRPMQKLARYCLLFQSVLKNEENQQYKLDTVKLISKLSGLAERVDRAYGRSRNFFRIYEIAKCLRKGEGYRARTPLNLFFKRRKLLKEGDAVVCTKSIRYRIHRVMVFDHLVLVCGMRSQGLASLLYLKDAFAPHRFYVTDEHADPRSSSVATQFPVYLSERNGDRFLGIFFRNRQERKVWADVLDSVIRRMGRHHDENIKISVIEQFTDEDMKYVCKPFVPFDDTSLLVGEDFSSSLDTDDEEEKVNTKRGMIRGLREQSRVVQKTPMHRGSFSESKNVQNFGLAVREPASDENQSFFNRILFGRDFFGRRVRVEKVPWEWGNDEVVFFSTETGMYKRYNGVNSRVYERSTKKIVFNGEIGLLMFQDEDRVVISPFNSSAVTLNMHTLHQRTESFFYCQNKTSRFIVVKKKGTDTFSMIYLYSVEEGEDHIRVSMFRRLYIGSDVCSIRMFGSDLVVASSSIEIVNPDSLIARDVLNPLDTYVPYYFFLCRETRARSILRVGPDHYLVCFDALGFIIDYYGRSTKSHIVFAWNCEPHDFRVAGSHLVVLGEGSTSVFSLVTGVLLFFSDSATYHFCSGDNGLLMHDSHRLYRLVLPHAPSEGHHV